MRAGRLLAALVALLALAGCRMTVAVDVAVREDETGSVTVGVGLDEAALARAGDLDQQLRVDDLVAAGWEVSGPQAEADGLTWVRATRGFAGPEEFAAVMGQITGPDGAFRDWRLTKASGFLETTWDVEGVVDLTGGPETFSDPALAAVLDGDPYGGTLARIEQEEGRPVSEMVDFVVRVTLPGADAVVTETGFGDPEPTRVAVSSSRGVWLAGAWIWALAVAVGALALIVLRTGFRRARG
jgi:hypothetical protein